MLTVAIRGVRIACIARHGERSRARAARDQLSRQPLGARAARRARAVSASTRSARSIAAFVPGELAVPDQLIDYTHGRAATFGGAGAPVRHIEFTEPFSPVLARAARDGDRRLRVRRPRGYLRRHARAAARDGGRDRAAGARRLCDGRHDGDARGGSRARARTSTMRSAPSRSTTRRAARRTARRSAGRSSGSRAQGLRKVRRGSRSDSSPARRMQCDAFHRRLRRASSNIIAWKPAGTHAASDP